ncbi:hypothetical protein BURMUCGD1_4459 [Burkholderia multivorans CGD1]|nr:hypothetical protein BURMUCGD1_4459 [Burkholderia multivorans CGD1]
MPPIGGDDTHSPRVGRADQPSSADARVLRRCDNGTACAARRRATTARIARAPLDVSVL